ncbi:DNA-directed RNA polymerase sigma-70 factor [Nocardioides psychrotolerans]|uniref:RNA polymerase sigma-70 factor, sigma-E family n=1 Tax=Nocardioides psychrotolerans TaxID=1005945 RepID=A0A1I3MU72_9ACTN|nr:SigE family RNA polymerase sigma factor [Nocardioides psychrotolerans]GEP39016.1 DNA-directed RNA polymerase sigma-70 factor [Nocardioides psychrotolerans]SFJ00275.1 RNA polymerase sigma-70 factor, sigma-E family [Nocardioides psychrotolerans]
MTDFDEFFAVAWPRLLRTTYAVTGDRQLAEDALQTAFTKAYAAWSRVSRADEPIAYVRKIALHTALVQQRKASARRETTVRSMPEAPVPGGSWPSAVSSEDGLLERDEVWAAIAELPPRQRAVVVLRYYEDLSERQIAETLGIRPGTVKSQSSAALSTLRGLLGDTTNPTVSRVRGER